MFLLKIFIVAFAFVDLFTSVRLGAVSVGALVWSSLGFLAFGFVVLHDGVMTIVLRNKWFVALALFALVNAYRATDLMLAAVDVLYIAIPLLFWWIAFRVGHGWDRVNKVFSAMMLSMWIPLLIIALAFAFGATSYVEGEGAQIVIGARSAALMAVPIVGVALSVLILGKGVVARKVRRRAFLALFIALAVILGTFSRTSILCLVVFALMMAWLAPRASGVGIAFFAGAIVVAAVLTVPALKERVLPEDMAVAEAIESGAFTSGRALIWTSVAEKAMEAPWLGYGTGNAKAFTAEHFELYAGLPHNEYLRYFYDGGAIGLALLVFAWLSRVRRYRRLTKVAIRRRDPGAVIYASALLCAVGTAIAGIFDNAFLYIFMTGNTFIIFGIADRYSDERLMRRPAPRARPDEPSPTAMRSDGSMTTSPAAR